MCPKIGHYLNVFCFLSLLLICAHSFLATVSETRHNVIQSRKIPSKNYCPKMVQLWLFWCLSHFLDVCLCSMSFFFALWVSYLFGPSLFLLQCLKLNTLRSRNKKPIEKVCPKIDQLYWCQGHFLDVCFFLINFCLLSLLLICNHSIFDYLRHADPEMKKPIRKFWASKLIIYDRH